MVPRPARPNAVIELLAGVWPAGSVLLDVADVAAADAAGGAAGQGEGTFWMGTRRVPSTHSPTRYRGSTVSCLLILHNVPFEIKSVIAGTQLKFWTGQVTGIARCRRTPPTAAARPLDIHHQPGASAASLHTRRTQADKISMYLLSPIPAPRRC